jgi:hypothetical protein
MKAIDETGNTYGKLTVLKLDKEKSGKNAYWICKCDCGNIISVSGVKLRYSQISCGCVKSKGEEKINQILTNNSIFYKTQISFETCKDIDLLRFDFGIYDNNQNLQYLIEYDGEQHFQYRNIGWNNKENFEKIQKSMV